MLMGVEFTQHPDLWNAVDIQVPLLDMLRFEQIAAGASWVGEYGSVSNPDERAFLDMKLPYLFYEVIEGGHGAGANIEQRAHTSALEYTYFARQLMDQGKIVP